MTELKKAVTAIIQNDFKKTFQILSPMAKNESASANFYLGYLFLHKTLQFFLEEMLGPQH